MAVPDPTAASTDRRVPTVVIDDVHVTFRVLKDRRMGLRQLVASGGRKREAVEVHAVRGVSLTAYEGESLGLIGPNGSGKTTLVRSIAGLLPVTGGVVYAKSQPSMLGVGAAMLPYLSGRKNAIIGGLALGLDRADVEAKIPEIIAFTGLKRSIDLPLRTYSSGMQARLRFAIATLVTPEILLVDEALSVGDRQFGNRSAQRIEEIRGKAGTVFIVSHNLTQVRRLCDRVVWMADGVVIREGPTEEVVDVYESDEASS